MNRYRTLQVASAVAAAAGLIVTAFGVVSFWVRLAAILITAISIGLFLRWDRRLGEERFNSRLVQTITHYRHDWMNDLQVLYGYIRLNKTDQAVEFMEKMKSQALQESYVSKLGIPELAVFFIQNRVFRRDFVVEPELEQVIDLTQLAVDGHTVYRLVSGVVKLIDECSDPSVDQPRVLSVGFDSGDHLLIDFVYQGKLKADRVREGLGALVAKARGVNIADQQIGEDQTVIVLEFPFRS